MTFERAVLVDQRLVRTKQPKLLLEGWVAHLALLGQLLRPSVQHTIGWNAGTSSEQSISQALNTAGGLLRKHLLS